MAIAIKEMRKTSFGQEALKVRSIDETLTFCDFSSFRFSGFVCLGSIT